MYKIEMVKQNNENQVVIMKKEHNVEDESEVLGAWDYLNDFDEGQIEATKGTLGSFTLKGKGLYYTTIVKVKPIISVPPHSTKIPDWFRELVEGVRND